MMGSTTNWFGIDFGTTNSAAFSFSGIDKENLQPITYGDMQGRPFPSIVAIDKKTGEVISGREAKNRRNELQESHEYFSAIKSILDEDKTWIIAGQEWTPVDIASQIFKAIKANVEAKTNSKLEEAVVAVPIALAPLKRGKLRLAAYNAGISIKKLISEPTAAFLSNFSKLKDCRNVAVFDWGGGTLDVAILEVTGGKITELATEGMDIAGNHIDRKIALKMHNKFMVGKTPVKSFDELDPLTKDQLLVKCELAKCSFSDDDIAQISINRYDEYGPVRTSLTYDYFDLLLEDEVNKAMGCLDKALLAAGLNSVTLDKILCVGGSSNLRPLREALERKYGIEQILYPRKVMWDIAKGAAMTSTQQGAYSLSKSIGIELSTGSYLPLFEEGQKIPTEEKNILLGTVDGSKQINCMARFIMTDGVKNEQSFTDELTLPLRGFNDEHIILSCYIDRDSIFKMKIGSNKMHANSFKIWSYHKLKIEYNMGGTNDK